MEHNWTQDFFTDGSHGGQWYGMQTCLQNFRCRSCGAKGIRPADGSLPDLNGCSGIVARPKIPRTSPFEGRDDDIETEKHTKDYQRHQVGKRNKR